MIVDLSVVKDQLGVTLNIDDDMIERKIAAAQSHIERLLGFKIEERFTADVPADLVEAVCLLVAHWYENREASVAGVSMAQIPYGVQEIVREHRCWSF